jgi:hypothetical protein
MNATPLVPGCLLCALVLGITPFARAADEVVLFDFEGDFDATKVETGDAKVSLAKSPDGTALSVATGHKQPWPGFTLKAPKGAWDLAKYESLAVDAKNTGTSPVTLHLRIDNAGADGALNCQTDQLALKPGEAGTLKAVFRRKPAGPAGVKLFGMRGYPVPQGGEKGVIDPAKITQLLIFVAKPAEDHAFQVDNIRAGGTYEPPKEATIDPARFFPFIDKFGQYVHREWPGKTHAVTDMEDRKTEEAAGLKVKAGPKDWDPYGGWKAGPTLQATGFFRAEKHDGKWWLVDPEGRLFWSHGIDCVNERGDTAIDERDTWFADLPRNDPAYKDFFGSAYGLHGYYKGRTVRTFDFIGANLLRKYGKNYKQAAAETIHKRLRSWGVNTIANWSDPAVYLMRKTPYTATVWFQSKPIQGSQGYWGQFKDPFEPQFAAAVKSAMAREAGKSEGDAWCIGYFVDNEMGWGDDTSLALAALASPPDQAAKKAFLEDLKAKYGDIAKLNAAWGTAHSSWEALLSSTTPPDRTKAAADLKAFYARLAEQYFQTVREAVKAVAPKQLYLGCRFAWVNDAAARAASKFCDIVSYNRYTKSVADLRLPAGSEDKPLVIGEFHFGALDRGMFHTGLVPTADQADRAAAYKAYVQGALANAGLVGTHWFKYQDEPTTGRPFDEENYQIGFLDVCDTPYPETVTASREVAADMYKFRAAAQ